MGRGASTRQPELHAINPNPSIKTGLKIRRGASTRQWGSRALNPETHTLQFRIGEGASTRRSESRASCSPSWTAPAREASSFRSSTSSRSPSSLSVLGRGSMISCSLTLRSMSTRSSLEGSIHFKSSLPVVMDFASVKLNRPS